MGTLRLLAIAAALLFFSPPLHAQHAVAGPVDIRGLELRPQLARPDASAGHGRLDSSPEDPDAPRRSGGVPEPAGGTLIGAGLGLGAGMFVLLIGCDASPCFTNSGSMLFVAGTTIVGTTIGYLVDTIRQGGRETPGS